MGKDIRIDKKISLGYDKYDKSYLILIITPYMKEPSLGMVFGTASVGPRGQIVIPKEIRDKIKTKEGDRFFVIEHGGKIIFVPEKITKNLIKRITNTLKNV